jgi:hypothetical protein
MSRGDVLVWISVFWFAPLWLARAALPESELAALPPEENAELVKRLAEEIRKAADEYQRMMRVVH